jgi:dipeptidyl aminopeptidase/acylaminoacyl peptidase
MAESPAGGTPFHDLAEYMAIPRVSELRLSPDGSWLAASVQTLGPGRKKYLTSIWRIDTQGGPPRRLTRSAAGESSLCFLLDGSLLFTSRRPDPEKTENTENDGETAPLWLLPSGGGEAQVIVALPGGVAAVASAREAGSIVVSSQVLPTAAGGPDGHDGDTTTGDEKLRKARKEAGVSAILHESAPIRYWDHDLGPEQLRLFAVAGDEQRDLTPEPGRALDEQAFELTPDGTSIITGWSRWHPAGQSRAELVAIDVATGKRQVLLSEPGQLFGSPRVSPDGRYVACLREALPTPEHPADFTLVLVDLTAPDRAGRDLLPALDRWPGDQVWAPDSSGVYFAADDNGRRPVFRVDIGSGEVTRLTTDDGSYTSLQAAPDGRWLYALRSAIDSPPTAVRIELTADRARPVPLECPGTPLTVPGRIEEIKVTADDGQQIRSWLVLPHTAGIAQPAPLLLWVHGGPEDSWNAWHWRWNPWLMAAKGYAVLLPDPALSTGYGQKFVSRGYPNWAARTFGDVMAATEGASARPDIDAERAAMMGASYGGYVANWIAGHTDRFKAIVSHAGLWMLDQMFGTTDLPMWVLPQWGDPLTSPEGYEKNSPHKHIGKITTPMLVSHGDKDYRVPISEGLRLWWDLQSRGADAKFLYFPDENHLILTPGNATIWYETVFAFLAQHVLGQEWKPPALL